MGQPNRIERIETRSMHTKTYRGLTILLLFLTVGALATGCSGVGAVSGGKQLTLGYIGWDENVAVSTLTKVLLEEELGYEVELQRFNVAVVKQVFRGVAGGDLDAWFEGKTVQGIAVPYYMDVHSLSKLDGAGTDMIIGIEPGSAVHPQIE